MANPLMRYVGNQAEHLMSTSYAWLKLHPILYLEGRIFFYSFQNCLNNWEFFLTTHGCSQASSNIIKYNAHNPSEIQMTKKSTSNCYKREPNEPLLPWQRLWNFCPENCTGLFALGDQNISFWRLHQEVVGFTPAFKHFWRHSSNFRPCLVWG